MTNNEWVCSACGNTGHAAIPLLSHVYQGLLVMAGRSSIYTAVVICDRSGCDVGNRLKHKDRARSDDKPRMMTLSEAERIAGGHDLVEILAEYRRFQASVSRGDTSERERFEAFAKEYPRLAIAAGMVSR